MEKLEHHASPIRHSFVLFALQERRNKLQTHNSNYHHFFKNEWKLNQEDGGLVYIAQDKIEKQKSVINFILRQIGTNLMKGKSILSISLPVDIFE